MQQQRAKAIPKDRAAHREEPLGVWPRNYKQE